MKIRRVRDKNNNIYHAFWCPGCKHAHLYGDTWKFNGDFEKPTFKPSLLIFIPEHIEDGKKLPRETICHLFLTDGKIQFLGDCGHELKGQTVDLSEWPNNYEMRGLESDAGET